MDGSGEERLTIRGEMNKMVKFQPDGWHTVTPRIVARNPEKLVRFLKDVFNAKGEFRRGLPAEIRIGDSLVMVSGDGQRDVEDTDATYQRAIAAHATSLEKPTDMPYGDRRAMVRDAWGNTWQVATHKEDLSADEISTRMGRST